MAASLPSPSFASSITKLPANLRSRAMRRISANANAPGGSKKQTKGRAQQAALQRLASELGIYAIETNVTGALAASVGGARPHTINAAGGTPASTTIATNELDPITWAAGGAKVLTCSGANGNGEAVVTV